MNRWKSPKIKIVKKRSKWQHPSYDVFHNVIFLRRTKDFCGERYKNMTDEDESIRSLIHELTHWAQFITLSDFQKRRVLMKCTDGPLFGRRKDRHIIERHSLDIEINWYRSRHKRKVERGGDNK